MRTLNPMLCDDSGIEPASPPTSSDVICHLCKEGENCGSMASVDALPDELLLLVLSFVGDARTLLDAVPLVCKRWLRLHRDRRVWAEVDIDVAESEERVSTFRYVLHAPAASSLSMVGYTCHPELRVPEDPKDPTLSRAECSRRLTSTLKRSAMVVSHLDLSTVQVDESLHGVLTDFLGRQGDHLRSLDLRIPLVDEFEGATKTSRLMRSFARLQRLERLRIRIDTERVEMAGSMGPFGGFKMPKLKELLICTWSPTIGAGMVGYRDYVMRMLNGVDTALPSLRALELPMTLGMEGVDAEAVVRLERLEKLTMRADVSAVWSIARHVVKDDVTATLNACRGMASLRSLRIHLHCNIVGLHLQDELRDFTAAAIKAFREDRPHVDAKFSTPNSLL